MSRHLKLYTQVSLQTSLLRIRKAAFKCQLSHTRMFFWSFYQPYSVCIITHPFGCNINIRWATFLTAQGVKRQLHMAAKAANQLYTNMHWVKPVCCGLHVLNCCQKLLASHCCTTGISTSLIIDLVHSFKCKDNLHIFYLFFYCEIITIIKYLWLIIVTYKFNISLI